MNAYQTMRSAAAEEGSPLARATSRGSSLVLGSTFWGWAGPALIMLFGGFLRFYRLSKPNAVVFDETYYVTDSNSILPHGVESTPVKNVNALLLQGNPNFLLKPGEVVAPPPLGKIMMA